MPLDSSHQTLTANSLMGRRRLLGMGLAAAAAGALAPASAWASLPPSPERSLAFYNTHTNETLKATYWRNGTADRGALTDINHILRDFRTGDVFQMDVKLLDLLAELHRRTGSKQPFQVISGYRSPKTNATWPPRATASPSTACISTARRSTSGSRTCRCATCMTPRSP